MLGRVARCAVSRQCRSRRGPRAAGRGDGCVRVRSRVVCCVMCRRRTQLPHVYTNTTNTTVSDIQYSYTPVHIESGEGLVIDCPLSTAASLPTTRLAPAARRAEPCRPRIARTASRRRRSPGGPKAARSLWAGRRSAGRTSRTHRDSRAAPRVKWAGPWSGGRPRLTPHGHLVATCEAGQSGHAGAAGSPKRRVSRARVAASKAATS